MSKVYTLLMILCSCVFVKSSVCSNNNEFSFHVVIKNDSQKKIDSHPFFFRMTIKTRRTKISNNQDRFDLFGIRLKVNESKMVHVPNTKVKKIQYLETHGHKIEKNCKANTINVLIRNVLISQGASLTKNSTIPKLFKQVYGDSQHKIRYGTVIGYMPAMQYHTILFDDGDQETVRRHQIHRNTDEPATGSEDFADMLKVVPGAYCRVGHAGTTGLHNSSFFLDPEILPIGASIMARIAERRLSS